MNYNDEQLKKTLAKMLPRTVCYGSPQGADGLYWRPHWNVGSYHNVRDTELLHLCHLAENTLCEYSGEHNNEWSQRDNFIKELMKLNGIWSGNGWSWGDVCDADLFQAANATWQERVIALAKVKGIEI